VSTDDGHLVARLEISARVLARLAESLTAVGHPGAAAHFVDLAVWCSDLAHDLKATVPTNQENPA
jgi:hypothetical protein